MGYDIRFMERALALAKIASDLGEVPVGAVIVKNGEIISEAYNLRESAKHPLAHAEIIAIDLAAKALGGWRLIDCDLYVTLEPCYMCAGAIVQSRIEQVYFGAMDLKSGFVVSRDHFFDTPWLNHRVVYVGGILEEEASRLLKEFFSTLRKR